MSTGFKEVGDSIVNGDISLNTARPNSNAQPTSEINSMTSAEIAALTFAGASINYNNQDSNLYFCPPSLATPVKLTNQIPLISNNTLLANTSGVTAAPTATPVVSPITLSGSGLGFEGFNATPSVPSYQIYNDSNSSSTSSLTNAVLKTATVAAGTFLADSDNVSGYFSGSFVIGSGTTAQIRIFVNGVLLVDALVNSFPSGSWTYDFQVMRASSTNLRCSARLVTDILGSTGVSYCGFGNITFNVNAALQIQLAALVSTGTNSVNCSLGICNGSKNI